MDQIQAVCYTCRIGYLRHVEIAEPQGTPQEVRAPVCPGASRPRGVGTGDSALPHTSLVLRRLWQRQRAGPRALACIASADQSASLGAEPGVQRPSRPPALGRSAPRHHVAKGLAAERGELRPVLQASTEHRAFDEKHRFHVYCHQGLFARKDRNPLELARRLP